MLRCLTFLTVLPALTYAACDMAGDWTSNNRGLSSKFLPAVDLKAPGAFNVTLDIRHGPGTLQGVLHSDNSVTIAVNSNETMTGVMASDCNTINFEVSNYGSVWCRSWTNNCTSASPPWGKTFGFWNNFMDNMVLQRAPAKAAVYGLVPGVAKPDVTVMVINNNNASNYKADVEYNTVQQPFGPGFGPAWTFPGPFYTWKALLPPTEAGGNYTIMATCNNCDAFDPMYRTSGITNVTFGDFWYCSGQSNMWLTMGHTFERNNTQNALMAGKYNNIRIQAGDSGDQNYEQFNPWMTARDAAQSPSLDSPVLFDFGAACWYFAQKLTDEMEAAGEVVPIGLQDTAVGGQRIEEYMDNTTISKCKDRLGEDFPKWDGALFSKFVMPYVDMTVKGWLWYQGENNMGGVKGNAIANEGYGCEMADLVSSWRARWSKAAGTTDPLAPFGIVTLASSGSEGGPDMGAMRWAQTANYGILPNPMIPNSFVAQAYDLDDPWGPGEGPCLKEWFCCGKTTNMTLCNEGTNNNPSRCDKACAAYHDTPVAMGGIHPRDKKPLGDRLGAAAWNTVYGGDAPFTGPTLAGCSVSGDSLEVRFNTTLLRGDDVLIQSYNMTLNMSYLEVMTDPTIFCVEPVRVNSSCRHDCEYNCPTWAGANSQTNQSAITSSSDVGWQPLNITLGTGGAITVDLSPLNGMAPSAVRYAWGTSECCNKADPNLYVDYPCGPAPCPIMGKSGFPANPFIARITDGKCECVAPQTCDG